MNTAQQAKGIEGAERLAAIQQHLAVRGNVVMVVTHIKATLYDHRHVGMFSAKSDGLYVQRGKRHDCLNYTPIKFGKRG